MQMALLVGGFAASPWLFSNLQAALSQMGVSIARPDRHTCVNAPPYVQIGVSDVNSGDITLRRSKAVAEGAVSYFLTQWVSYRIARLTYGTSMRVRYDPSNSEHTQRSRLAFRDLSGGQVLPGGFDVLLAKASRIS